MADKNQQQRLEPQIDRPTSGPFAKFLSFVEWLGNLLPHPVTLFALFGFGVIIASGIATWCEVSVVDPRYDDGTRIGVNNLMSGDGLRWMSTNLVTNFTDFRPLGTVLVALLGVGVAEHSGLLKAVIRGMILAAPKTLVTLVIVFAGVLSNTASEMGYVVIIPLGATIFHALGRHPLAGLAAAFAGVSGGYSANLLIGTVDPLLAGITEEAARFMDPTYEVHAAVNWYFMIVSTFLIAIVGTLVTALIVEPRLGTYDDSNAEDHVESDPSLDKLDAREKRGLKLAGLTSLALVLVLVYLAGPRVSETFVVPTMMTQQDATVVPMSMDVLATVSPDERHALVTFATTLPANETMKIMLPMEDNVFNNTIGSIPGWGVMRDPVNNALMPSPFLRSVVTFIFVFFVIPGFVYGRVTGTMRGDRDVIDAMARSMSSMGLYIVLVFFAAQFVAFFSYTNLGQVLAVVGADLIKEMNMDNAWVFIPFILMCCFVNLMLGSASAQWAVTAPIFVPMLMVVGYSPEVIQAAYRIGDSTTNIITPMMSYFGLILAFAARYDRKLGIGTLISTMLPYSIMFLLGWIVLFYLWVFVLGLPVGPGAPTTYTLPMG